MNTVRDRDVTFYKIVGILALLLFFGSSSIAQTLAPVPDSKPSQQPRNLKLLDEHKDDRGYTIRTVQYDQGAMRVTETTIIPPQPSLYRMPIKADTMNKDSTMIVVNKSGYNVQLYYRRKMIRTYKAVFGPHPLQDKCTEGDRCTPEGWYRIASKNPASRYDRFMGLNYPNDSAYARFNRMKAQGKIPADAKIGGDVGIHGIWKGGDDMIEMGVGWTDGCIALKNKDIEELYSLVGVGTRVFIRK